MFRSYVSGMDVALVQWPSDESLRLELAQREQSRLLLVSPDADPPVCVDTLEDWVRLPVSRDDRNARIRALEERAGRRDEAVPILTGDGTLEFRDERTQLSETQTRIIAALIDRFGVVVSRAVLVGRAWPGADASSNNLDVAVGRLRRQIEPVDLEIRTVRSRGYLLCASAPLAGAAWW